MIKLTKELESGKIIVHSPFHPAWAEPAKELGGKAKKGSDGWYWIFDLRDEKRVRELLISIYGTDGLTNLEMCDVKVTFREIDRESSCNIYVFGRQVVRVMSRDSGAVLGQGVILLSGKFWSGGSMKNPGVFAESGTTVEIRDVPLEWVECRLESNDLDPYVESVEIVRHDSAELNREALEAEAVQLRARLAEIEKLLAQ